MTLEWCKWASLTGVGVKRRPEDRTPYITPLSWVMWDFGAIRINKVYAKGCLGFRSCEGNIAKLAKIQKKHKQTNKKTQTN